MSELLSNSPLPITIAPHPYLASRFTHMVAQRDAVARGWHFFGDCPLGVWRSREAARRAARRLHARGIVTLDYDRRRA